MTGVTRTGNVVHLHTRRQSCIVIYMSNEMSTKQAEYIASLQQGFAYLIGADKPSIEEMRGRADLKASADHAAVEQVKAEQNGADVFALSSDEKRVWKARRLELTAAELDRLAGEASAAWDAKQAALVADVDGISSEQASALIDALKGW